MQVLLVFMRRASPPPNKKEGRFEEAKLWIERIRIFRTWREGERKQRAASYFLRVAPAFSTSFHFSLSLASSLSHSTFFLTSSLSFLPPSSTLRLSISTFLETLSLTYSHAPLLSSLSLILTSFFSAPLLFNLHFVPLLIFSLFWMEQNHHLLLLMLLLVASCLYFLPSSKLNEREEKEIWRDKPAFRLLVVAVSLTYQDSRFSHFN